MEQSIQDSQYSSLPQRYSSMGSIGVKSEQDQIRNNANQFYHKQVEIMKLQKALSSYQALGKIQSLNYKTPFADTEINNLMQLKLPQIKPRQVKNTKDFHLKRSQPIKISAQIKYNPQKDAQELQSNNLNGNYYYLQDKNNQWKERKSEWISSLDNCLKSGFLDYQEMYEKFFKNKYLQKLNMSKKKPNVKKINQVNQIQQKSVSIEKNEDTDDHEESFENLVSEEQEQIIENIKREQIAIQDQKVETPLQEISQNTNGQISNRQENKENNEEDKSNEDGDDNKSIEQNENNSINAIDDVGDQQIQTVDSLIKPISQIAINNSINKSEKKVHQKNKSHVVSQENSIKMSIITPLDLSINNYSFNTQLNLHQNSTKNMQLVISKYSTYEQEANKAISPLMSHRESRQEFSPLSKRYDSQNFLRNNLNLDRNRPDGLAQKFSLAQLKTKNFSKVTQSSQKSEDFVFRVSQVQNLRKY